MPLRQKESETGGVRNGPPYPIEDTVLKAGTRLNSVANEPITETYKNTGRSIYTYRPDELWDKKVYEGPFSDFLIQKRGAERIRVHEFETTKDMKMPTSKERKDRFKELLDDKKKGEEVKEALEGIRKMCLDYDMISSSKEDPISNLDINNIKTKKDLDTAYELFLFALENPYEYNSSREYMKRMSKNYDAMVDDNDQGGYKDARDPRFLTNDEINKNIEEVRTELDKNK